MIPLFISGSAFCCDQGAMDEVRMAKLRFLERAVKLLGRDLSRELDRMSRRKGGG